MTRVPLTRTVLLVSAIAIIALAACSSWTKTENGHAAPPARRVKVDRPNLPLANLTEQELSRFNQGDALFEAILRESDGLGPLYVRDACNACHVDDGRGPGLVTKAAPLDGDPKLAQELLPFGSTERPYTAAGARVPLLAPPDARLRVTHRLPPAVFGRGYLEAISDADLERLAERAQARAGSAKGRLNRLKNGAIGRFGLKARIATLADFTADALSSDMGISSPAHPEEQPGPEGIGDDAKPGVDFSTEQVEQVRDYLRGLQIPERPRPESGARAQELFAKARCNDCHEPSFETSRSYPVRALSGVRAEVYTDLLLHDMGAALSDGLTEESAGPREFRTAPLIGLRFLPSFLHDGSATTVEQAIVAHGAADSEGRDSARAFAALASEERRELVRFVEAL
jgi:CxxC motif-containing protein (DUF1111 family)